MKTTVRQWMHENPRAAKDAIRQNKRGASQRSLLSRLRKNHSYPGTDRGALAEWLRDPNRPAAVRSVSLKKRARASFVRSERQVKALGKSQDLFVTCAVSSSHANLDALRALELAAQECGGSLVVHPVRYVNPTSRSEDARNSAEEWWAPEVVPYLLDNELRPHPLLSVMTTRTQATAGNPLPPKLGPHTHERSAVYGHPNMCMRTVATPQQKLPKILYTSGAITHPNYSDTATGDVARLHHRIAAVKIEVRGDRFHLRDIHWDGNAWTDIDRLYTPSGVEDAPRASVLALGDVHVGTYDEEAYEAVFGSSGLIETVRPQFLVLHDLLDGRAVNPHERNNALLQAARRQTVMEEVSAVAEWLRWLRKKCPGYDHAHVVRSNHDDFLDRWLSNADPRPEDAEVFHWLSWRLIRAQRETGTWPMALETLVRKIEPDLQNLTFLGQDQTLRIGDVEYGFHGHNGPDGARGTPGNMAQIGTKFVSGHRHSPAIWLGGYWAGVLCRTGHDYAKGPSSWMSSHVLQGDSGKRQMIHVIGKHFRG